MCASKNLFFFLSGILLIAPRNSLPGFEVELQAVGNYVAGELSSDFWSASLPFFSVYPFAWLEQRLISFVVSNVGVFDAVYWMHV